MKPKLNKKKRIKKELIIEEYFSGTITYSSSGMRHQDEEESFYLNKGDKVYIQRKEVIKG